MGYFPAHPAGHKRKSLVKIGEVTPPKRPSILGPLELGEPIDHSGTPPSPPRSSMGRFSTPPSNSDPPSYPPLGLATGADELAHAVALGLKPSGLRCRRPIRDEPALCEDRDNAAENSDPPSSRCPSAVRTPFFLRSAENRWADERICRSSAHRRLTSREHRRAKTDRLDTELLKRAFLGWLRGERDHCKMVAIPTSQDEDAKRPNRERESLVGEQNSDYQPNESNLDPARHPRLQSQAEEGRRAT